MEFHLQTANTVGNKYNLEYPNAVEVKSADQLQGAVCFDHVCASYKENKRSTLRFEKSDVVPMDCDNDHSDDPKEWVTLDMLAELFEGISYAAVPSKNNMVQKDSKSARPRFHVYFPITQTVDVTYYKELKKAIQKKHPFFDKNALDAGRFLFGSNVANVIWSEGWNTIDEEVKVEEDGDGNVTKGGRIIQEGTRNKTMHRFAGAVLKRFGDGKTAFKKFQKRAEDCSPPLEEAELEKIWKSAQNYYNNTVKVQPGYVSPDQYGGAASSEDVTFGGNLKPEDYSDIGQAKVLKEVFGNMLHYSAATDFLCYNGKVWKEEEQRPKGLMIRLLDAQLKQAEKNVEDAKEILIDDGVGRNVAIIGGKMLRDEVNRIAYENKGASDIYEDYTEYREEEEYLTFVKKRRENRYIVSALNTAKPMLEIPADDLDKDVNLLNTPEGTYNLTKGVQGVQPHNEEDLITKITACAPGDTGMDLWLQALDLFFCGDTELIEYAQKVVGMAAIGKVYQEAIIIAYGDGANGKSTFWNPIAKVLGSYSGKLSAEALTAGCKKNVKAEMAELKGKRLVIASETEEGMRLNTAMIKQLCSTDEIYAEKKYKAPFAFTPTHTLVLYTNHLPKVGANDAGTWRRLIVIPFKAKIQGNNDIKNYGEYLYENAGPAILKWMIEGAEKVMNDSFKMALPKCVEEAIEEYREENDWMSHFLSECCEEDDSYKEKSGALYQKYREYAASNGEFIRNNGDFYAALKKAGFKKHKTNKGMFVHGLKLKDADDLF